MEISGLGDRLGENIIYKQEEQHKCQERQANTAEKNKEFGVRLPMFKFQVFYLLCNFENYSIIWSVTFLNCVTGTIKLSSLPLSQVGCDD